MSDQERILAAARDGDAAVVRDLLARDPALVGAVDVHHKTPLHLAAEHDHPEVAELVLEAGADPSLRDQRFDSDALGWAREGGHGPVIALLER